MIKQLNEMLKQDHISPKEITAIVFKYQKCRHKAKKQEYKDIVFNNVVRMISKRAAQYATRNRHLDVEDLFQAGVIGFCEAIEKFKKGKKTVFSTYLDIWVRKYMYDLGYENNLIYTPKNVIQHAYQQERKQLEGKKFQHSDLSQLFMNSKRMVYLDNDHSMDGGDGVNIHDMIKSGIEIDAEVDKRSMSEHMMSLIHRYLNASEQQVIKMRYFNGSGEVQQLQSVGQAVNLSTERVRQIETMAIAKLKKRTKGLIQ